MHNTMSHVAGVFLELLHVHQQMAEFVPSQGPCSPSHANETAASGGGGGAGGVD